MKKRQGYHPIEPFELIVAEGAILQHRRLFRQALVVGIDRRPACLGLRTLHQELVLCARHESVLSGLSGNLRPIATRRRRQQRLR